MTGSRSPWPVRLTATAEADFREIVRWTVARFGEAQARAYARTLSAAIEALSGGPTVGGVRTRNDIAEGLFTLHVARNRRKGPHFVLFRVGRDGDREVIEVLRLLHEGMDLARHVPPAPDAP